MSHCGFGFRAVLGGFPKLEVPLGGPRNKNYNILGSILGSILGNYDLKIHLLVTVTCARGSQMQGMNESSTRIPKPVLPLT